MDQNTLKALSIVTEAMHRFQSIPTKGTRLSMLMALKLFQSKVTEGLNIPKTIPEVIRNSRDMSQWHKRQLDESLAMFKIDPTRDDRYEALAVISQGYLDGVSQGRIRP